METTINTKTLIHQSSYHLSGTASTFLNELNFWATKDLGKIVNGIKYIYNTLDDWIIRIRTVCKGTLWRNIRKLRNLGIILFEQFNKCSYDRTGYYAINWEKLEEFNKSNFEAAIVNGKLESLILRGYPLHNLREYEQEIAEVIENLLSTGRKKQLLRQNMEFPDWVMSLIEGYEESQTESKLNYRKPQMEKPMKREDPYMGRNSARYQNLQTRINPYAKFPDGPWMDMSEDEDGRINRTINQPFLKWTIAELQRKFNSTRVDARTNAMLMFKNDPVTLAIYWDSYSEEYQDKAENIKARIEAGGTISDKEKKDFVENIRAVASLEQGFQVLSPVSEQLKGDACCEADPFGIAQRHFVIETPQSVITASEIEEMLVEEEPKEVLPVEVPEFTKSNGELAISAVNEAFEEVSSNVEGFSTIGKEEDKKEEVSVLQTKLDHLKALLEVGVITQEIYDKKVAMLTGEKKATEVNQEQVMEEILSMPTQEDYSELSEINQKLGKLNSVFKDIVSRKLRAKYPDCVYLLKDGALKEVFPPDYGQTLLDLPLDPEYSELPLLNEFLANCPSLIGYLSERLPIKYQKYKLNFHKKRLLSIEAPEF